ncbi:MULTISPECIES: hypothetical protein [unclassified Pseudomonas]|uniref:hypothetical protein n=1 Tax=unclassified Pseudomonas TaxID=196821 RepID=UPI0011991BB2|nr:MULTISPECIES: hypothetical protein [unclassified Pseudomonas]TWC18938.1 hypothetical protein FBY00_10696 [Pseudomonas sp. SJZ075]TWC19510.1 hypothetical protein FBX99_1114 [Pseudomonas sp. SJZ074]TWC33374.1 hypothetical protein FBY02_10996 [Pseudomonas sp. SJZ078]TWC37664.1 hypothetical protein FBY06_111125 [Pseudomonas sp. SJZ085]TWC55868.1 hypothetical protein FBY11_106116 [Pseudomonas sp. SJZ124]
MTESPYITHREILLNGMYGTAYCLQQFVLHQLDPYRYAFDIDNHSGGLDGRHIQIYKDMKQWYWDNGQASAGFKEVAEIIQSRRVQQAQSNLEQLRCLREMRPEDYPHEPGENQLEAYRNDVELHEWHHREHVAKGDLDE